MSDSSNSSVEILSGGGVRVSHGAPQPQAGAAMGQPVYVNEPRSRVYTGVTTYTVGQGEAAQSGVSRHSVSYEGSEGGSVIGTVRREGTGQSVELEPGNPASRTSLEVAARMGIIRKDPNGNYQDVKTAEGKQQTFGTLDAQAKQDQAKQASDAASEQAEQQAGIFNQAEDAAFVTDMADIPDHAFRAAAAGVTRAITLDGDLDHTARRLASESGMEPAQASEVIARGIGYYEAAVNRAVAKVGLYAGPQREAFYDDLRNDPARMGNAVQFLMHGRDASHFQALAREWMEAKERRAASKGGKA